MLTGLFVHVAIFLIHSQHFYLPFMRFTNKAAHILPI